MSENTDFPTEPTHQIDDTDELESYFWEEWDKLNEDTMDEQFFGTSHV